jgi:hypothetical protein
VDGRPCSALTEESGPILYVVHLQTISRRWRSLGLVRTSTSGADWNLISNLYNKSSKLAFERKDGRAGNRFSNRQALLSFSIIIKFLETLDTLTSALSLLLSVLPSLSFEITHQHSSASQSDVSANSRSLKSRIAILQTTIKQSISSGNFLPISKKGMW